ncbi:hypothetical protein M9Y10_041298 [Tritrichomonas musculus]|uniref:CYRIA/CYRIB Rac1 binding domain-containing protein n=1 Tax=Tritrichomonas musculus TaxID=1915356 RepID=A0ABR2K425_9EUKA
MDKKGKHSDKKKVNTTVPKPGIPIPKSFNQSTISNEVELLQPLTPEVVAPAAQISFAAPPTFARNDVPSGTLNPQTELKHIEILQKMIDTASEFIPFLYSYRSISKAINSDKIPDDQKIIKNTLDKKLDKDQVFQIFSQIFEAPFQKLNELMKFCNDASDVIQKAINNVQEPSNVFFKYFTQLLDYLFNIDNLKLVKTGITNDLSFYKRKFTAEDQGISTVSTMQVWLSTKNSILYQLKSQKNIFNFYQKYLEYCINADSNSFLLPKEHNSLVIGITCALFVAGGKIYEQPIAHKALEIIEKNCIIPLYAENSFAPGYLLAESEGFQGKGKNIATTAEMIKTHESEYLIKNKMDKYREMYRQSLKITSSLSNQSEIKEKNLLVLLSNAAEMANAISLQFAFKMVCLKQVDSSEKVSNYDRGIRLNYTSDDFDALIELIGYVKTLSSTAIEAEQKISEYVTKTANHCMQNFLVNDIEKLMIQCGEDKEAINILSAIRDTFVYWHGGSPPKLSKKKVKDFEEHTILDTTAALTDHLIETLYVSIQDIVKSDSIFMKKHGKFGKHISSSKDTAIYTNFLEKCDNYLHLINYSEQVRNSTNLGALWYREMFLDIDQIIQFPVRSSLPFILAEHLLNISGVPALHDSMMYPFEIYNDAAYLALNTFKSQYLYREIEAEVSLCIDMIAFTFSETFYRFARENAAAIELPNSCAGKIVPTPMRYNIIVLQNKLMLLGSQVDFNEVTTEKLNEKMQKELESYIELLTDVRLASYVSHLVRVTRTAHSFLVENHLLMDPFDTIWQRAIAFTNPLSLESRLVAFVSKGIDFAHYRFNSVTHRFVCNKELMLLPVTTEKWATVYSAIHEMDKNCLGTLHFIALHELLSDGEICIFIEKITYELEEELNKFIDSYTKVASVLQLLPPINKDELLSYYNFNSDAYHSFHHPSLRQLYHSMRIIGNIVSYVWCLELQLDVSPSGKSLLSPILMMIRQFLYENYQLFIQPPELDIESSSTHRSFASLWTILEFLMCSPRSVKMGDSGSAQPLEAFGDGPIICANLIIEICNQTPYEIFDSMNDRSIGLNYTQDSKIMGHAELQTYLKFVDYSQQAASFARFLASPYKIENQPEA